ncbi:BON domain-containing protein [candidate division KSB1 bacterium]|nr:BON domain-containing protein [candidate division KSB1 bacterium]
MSKKYSLNLFVIAVFLLIPFKLQAAQYALVDTVADKDITTAVERELEHENAVSAHLIDVETKNGVVKLSGWVEHLLAKEKATSLAMSVRGVLSVINDIRVKPAYREDEEIKNDVITALILNPATDRFEIDLKIEDGIAILKGTVASWQERELTENVVKNVKGIREIDNRLIIERAKQRPDIELQKEIRGFLDMDVWVDAQSIDVDVSDGVVTLKGNVGSATEKASAINDCLIPGVKKVNADSLKVIWWERETIKRPIKGAPKSDVTIRNAIEQTFTYDPRLEQYSPEVSVDDGIVTLSGTVGDLQAKSAAKEDAENTAGVLSVENKIKVRPETLKTDTRLARDIRKALEWDPYLDRHEVVVSVSNSKAYIAGSVNTAFEKQRASKIASEVNGVVAIENNIKVDENLYDFDMNIPWQEDWKISRDVRLEMLWNPYIEEDSIKIDVLEGVVTLTGTVETYQQKRMARKEAFQGGAKAVKNKLEVLEAPYSVQP